MHIMHDVICCIPVFSPKDWMVLMSKCFFQECQKWSHREAASLKELFLRLQQFTNDGNIRKPWDQRVKIQKRTRTSLMGRRWSFVRITKIIIWVWYDSWNHHQQGRRQEQHGRSSSPTQVQSVCNHYQNTSKCFFDSFKQAAIWQQINK